MPKLRVAEPDPDFVPRQLWKGRLWLTVIAADEEASARAHGWQEAPPPRLMGGREAIDAPVKRQADRADRPRSGAA